MTRKLNETTRELKRSGRKALVAFLTAGYPDEETFLQLVRTADQAGCDVIEMGIPFSDPIADGPVIQASSKAALDAGVTLERCLALASELEKDIDASLVFMSYINPILRMDPGRFAARGAETGVAGVIVPDLSLEDSMFAREAFRSAGLCYIDLVAPTSGDDRIDRIAHIADGFLYLVSVTGVTGARAPQATDIERFVARVRKRSDLPLYVGFGISSPAEATSIAQYADGVIIGSALIRLTRTAATPRAAIDDVGRFLRGVRERLDALGGADGGQAPSDPR